MATPQRYPSPTSLSDLRQLYALLALLAAGCAVAPRERPPEKPAERPKEPVARPQERPAERLGKPGPIPVRPLNVKAACAFRDETGYQGAMQLHVAEARVTQFDATVNVPRHGSCRFALKDFRQTGSMPSVTLKATGSRCVVRMWEQGRRVTVAFSDCEDMCTGEAFTYLWPFLADSHDGTCG